MELTLVNNLEDRDNTGEWNQPRKPNTTNLHLHGMHVSGRAPGDDIRIIVPPRGSYSYKYEIPEDHMPGHHWYRPAPTLTPSTRRRRRLLDGVGVRVSNRSTEELHTGTTRTTTAAPRCRTAVACTVRSRSTTQSSSSRPRSRLCPWSTSRSSTCLSPRSRTFGPPSTSKRRRARSTRHCCRRSPSTKAGSSCSSTAGHNRPSRWRRISGTASGLVTPAFTSPSGPYSESYL